MPKGLDKFRGYHQIVVLLGLVMLSACEFQTQTATATQSIVSPTKKETKKTATQAVLILPPTTTFTPIPSKTPRPATATSFEIESLEKGINPLSGLPVEDLKLLELRPVAVKINSYPRSNRPQWGLSKADIVYEYYHNNELTRFHAIFYGQHAEWVGPIRSARLPDEYLMDAYDSVLVYASADSRIQEKLQNSFPASRLLSILEGECPPKPVCRYEPKSFNYLLADTAKVSQFTQNLAERNLPPNLKGMSFSDQKPKSNDEVEKIFLNYSYAAYSYWQYDSIQRNYLRNQDAWDDVGGRGESYILLTDRLNGNVVRAENVVVLFANHFHFYYKPAAGGLPASEIVDIDLVGRGKAYAFRNGLAYELEWVREKDSVLRLEFSNGDAYDFKPGNTWFQVMSDESELIANGDNWIFNFIFR